MTDSTISSVGRSSPDWHQDDTPIGPPPRPSGAEHKEPDYASWHAPLVYPPPPAAPAGRSEASRGAMVNGNVDPSAWPDALLERQSAALGARLHGGDYLGRADDAAALLQIEQEIARRQKSDHTPQVELCRRPANIPVLKQLGAEHHWIRTTHVEAGMGPKTGGVPGKDSHVDMPGDPTSVNDHRGEGAQGASCAVVADVDEACVEKELEIGRDAGPWTPMNQCQTFAADVLEKCSTKPKEPVDVLPKRKPIEPKL
jgi:hypothetical protein